jgi:hypothetical protein
MAIVSKTYRDGLDKVVNILQNKFYPRLLGFWDASAVYTMYPRVNKNYKNDQLKPFLSLDNKDYKETLYDDRVSVNSFFIGDDVSEWEYSNQQIRREVSIVFQANLDALYSNAERIDEAFNNDVLRVLKQPNGYIVGDIQIAEGVDQVYNDFSITSEFKEKLKLDDIGKRHVVKFTFEVIYDLNCEKRVVKACADVTSSFNGSGITSTPSGVNKAIIVQTNEAIPVQTGTIINDTASELRVEVPAGVLLDRIYLRPQPTGQTAIYQDYDDGWKVANSADTYNPPDQGYPMRLNPSNMWKVIYTNVFGHLWRITGTTGGYWDNILLGYYDVNGNSTTYALAFPNDYMIDHHTGLGWVNTTLTSKKFLNVGDNIFTQMNNYSNAGFNDYFVGNKNENDSITDIGRQWAFYNQPPFDNIGATNKWSSTSAAYSTTTAYSNRITGETTGTSKGTSQVTIPMRYHFT